VVKGLGWSNFEETKNNLRLLLIFKIIHNQNLSTCKQSHNVISPLQI